jgi:hypothetical protein
MLDLLIEISPTISTGYNGDCGTSTNRCLFGGMGRAGDSRFGEI